ncbi:Sec-independent protein translocase subunit TatA/TatB [Paratractidigestivibacter faecalis]|uniref:Sec-independent protein translocase subunit TatA/TatB n=1 Tax=Paratractidigestivibacter faecalis TaxID=2292441 RepID=UPI003A95605E
MFGIGETELALILIFAFMIFGPDKLPGMGKTLGRALRQFRNAQEGFTQVVQTEIVDPAAEAMGDKKPNRKRSEEFEEDADIEGGEGKPAAKRSETFAERKARLEAERRAAEEAKAAEAAEAAAAASETEAAADDASADADAPAAEAPVAPAPAEPAAQPEENKPLTAADLYAVKRPAKTEAPADDQNQKEA